MDVVRLHATLPATTTADFEAAVLRILTPAGIALTPQLVDVDVAVDVGQRVAIDLGDGTSVVCRALGVVVRVGRDGAIHVDVSDVDEVWAALQARVRPNRSGLLASVPDAFVVDDAPPAIQQIDLRHREALLARMLAGAGNDDTLEGDDPGIGDDGPSTASGPVRPAPVLLDLPDFAAFPDAVPPPGSEEELPRVFERQSTDVDLLGEISASDVIALDDPGEHSGDENDDDIVDIRLADLPSMDAELLDDDTLPPVPLMVLRPLPVLLDVTGDRDAAPVVAVGWTVSRRGTPSGVEHFGWPRTGTRRELIAPALDNDDGDVFSTPPTPVAGDPYAAQDSDPSLDVEHIVARNTRVADIFADSDDDLFRSSGDDDVTRDEMPLPRLATPPRATLVDVSTTVLTHDSSDERSAG